MRKEFMLVPKNGKGCVWYTNKENIFKVYATVTDKAGLFQTVVRTEEYIVVKA